MNSSSSEHSVTTPAPSGTLLRRDSMPAWVIILLIFFFVLRVVEMRGDSAGPASAAKHATAQESNIDTATVQNLVETDLQSKMAFMSSYTQLGANITPDAKSLKTALKSVETLQSKSQNSPSSVRRLLILRALLKLPPFAVGKNGFDPRAAFTTDLPVSLSPQDKANYKAEGQLWQTIFMGGRLKPSQLSQIASEVHTLPNIRWWYYPAMAVVYQGQGNMAAANRYADSAREHALTTLLPALVTELAQLGLVLLGFGLLVYFVFRSVNNMTKARENKELSASPWRTLPEPISYEARCLGAGDLMAVFVVFLVTREAIDVVLSGFPGVGGHHWLHFSGVLTPYIHRIQSMSAYKRNIIMVTLESFAYLMSAAPPFYMLWSMARKRGASLGDEIGLTRRNLGPNIIYGMAGYGLAAVFMIVSVLIVKFAPSFVRDLPTPSNPAIPQLVNASGFWAPVLLTLLAAICAPIVEEILFRGIFYNAAKLRLGVWPAIVLTGVTFALMHPVGLTEMLTLATLGGVFAWMAETRKSLVPSMVGHFLQNSMTSIMILFVFAK